MHSNAFGAIEARALTTRSFSRLPQAAMAALAARCLAEIACWARRRRERAILATFDDRMLKDIGISRADASQEINKPFWRK